MQKHLVKWIAVIVTWQAGAMAEGSDPGAARAQLQQGYVLKQKGNCAEAIPHFVESVRLDRHPKGLLNLADCEAKTGKLVSAQAHDVEARDLARARGLSDFESLASRHLAELEKRIPRLVIKLAKDAPMDTVVLRDDVELGSVSLGTPLPLDPGAHVVVARRAGLERKYEITLVERDLRTIEVSAVGGSKTSLPSSDASPASSPKAVSTAAESERRSAGEDASARVASGSSSPAVVASTNSSLDEPHSSWSTQKTFAVVGVGVGVAAMATSLGLALSAKSSANDAATRCPEGQCENAADVDQASDAKTLGNVATGVFAVGAAALVAGGILWFTAPGSTKSAFRVVPGFGASHAEVVILGRY